MKRFKNILYIIEDESIPHPDVTDKVVTLARLNSAQVTVVRLVEEGVLEQLGSVLFGSGKDAGKVLVEQMRGEIDAFIDSSIWEGVAVSSDVLKGKGFIKVIQKVLRDNHDLVVKRNMVDEGVDPLAMKLMRKCPTPIWVLNGHKVGEIKRVLAALDVSAKSEESVRLNRKILELGYSLAQREGGDVHFLHAWHLESETMLRGPRFNMSEEKISELKDTLRTESEEQLITLLKDTGIPQRPGHLHLLEGATDTVIERTINRLDIDMLVLGTLGRSGIPGLLIGNTVENLLSTVNCSVLAVKPDGFISPVTLES